MKHIPLQRLNAYTQWQAVTHPEEKQPAGIMAIKNNGLGLKKSHCTQNWY